MNRDDQRREWQELKAKLGNYLAVYDEPIPSLREVNAIPDAPICGGGKLTLALDGTHREVNYHFSKSDFWSIVLRPDMLFQKYHVRQASLCRLNLAVHNAARQADGFRHVQDMSKAEIRSDLPLDGGMLRVCSVALAQRDLAVYELEATGSAASVTVRLDTANEHENFFILKGVHDNATVWIRKEHTSFMTFNACAALRAVGAENLRAECDEAGVTSLSFDVNPGRSTRLLLSIQGGKDEYKHVEQALAVLDGIGPAEESGLLDAHAAWWQAFWLRSWVDLGDPVLERYYYGAQYVHGCSIDLDARAVPGLAGGWITNPDPLWGGTYTMNYNGEAPFWGLPSSNRGEWILPYARVCLDFIPTGRTLARRLDTRGMVMPVMIGPWGVADNDDALGQKGNASLAALSLIWHYEFSRDRQFLEEYLYPYLCELMEFWEDNVTLDESGRYVIAESAARERTPGDLNPGPELGYLRKALTSAIAFSEELGVDEDRRDLWRDMLNRLSDYPAMEVDGGLCFMEAENRMEVSTDGVGDNPVVLDHVYPGGALDEDDSEKGRIIARNTLRYLDSWNQANGFPRIFSQAVRAEWPGGELLDLFKRRITRGPGPHEILRRNNTFLPEDHSYEGVGAIEFINAMLAQAHGGVLKAFHLWPREQDASFRRLRVKGAFLVSGDCRGGEVQTVHILSEQGRRCRMRSCWPGRSLSVEQVGKGAGPPAAVQAQGDLYGWDTIPGATYRVTAGDPVETRRKNSPAMLVPALDPSVQTGWQHTNAALDVLLTPDLRSTQLEFDVIYADETRRRCTHQCTCSSRDPAVVKTGANGRVEAAGRGRTKIDVAAEIDGEHLSFVLDVYVLTVPVIPITKVTAHGKSYPNWTSRVHSTHSLRMGCYTDGPDVLSRQRANSYGQGLFAVEPDGGELWVQFDLGEVHELDEMWVWNYGAPDDYRVLWWNGGSQVGLRDIAIEYSVDGERWETLSAGGHPFRLAKASGELWMSATNLDDGKSSPIPFAGIKARYVKVIPDPRPGVGNWGADRFGLGQVRFTKREVV